MIVVPGATGNIGRALVRALVAAGEPVRVVTRDPARAATLGHAVHVVQGNLEEPGTIRAALPGVDRVFMLALTPAQEATIITAAEQAGVRQLVMLSSRYVPFGVGSGPLHASGERQLRASTLGWTILRPAEFMRGSE